jgi:ATP-dependent Clp protease adapter protein ClpS
MEYVMYKFFDKQKPIETPFDTFANILPLLSTDLKQHTTFSTSRKVNRGAWTSGIWIELNTKNELPELMKKIKKETKSRKEYLVVLSADIFKMCEALRGLDEVNHVDLAKGKDVISSGTIDYSRKPTELKITNMSGSYVPEKPSAIINLLLVLRALGIDGTDSSYKIKVVYHNTDGTGKYRQDDITNTKVVQTILTKFSQKKAYAQFVKGYVELYNDSECCKNLNNIKPTGSPL